MIIGIIVSVLLSSPIIVVYSEGHRDGCHRWHSCPSDDGSYVCGDLGYDDECSSSNDEDEDDDQNSNRNSLNDEEDDNRNDDDNGRGENDDDDSNDENSEQITETTLVNKNQISASDLCSGSANCFTGTISNVVDGDTVDVDEEIRIRLTLINTPEQDEQGYQQAKDFVGQICGVGTKVIVDEDDGQKADSYGRMIGLVYCGDEELLLNQILIERGYAQIFDEYCESSEFSEMNWAQNNGCS